MAGQIAIDIELPLRSFKRELFTGMWKGKLLKYGRVPTDQKQLNSVFQPKMEEGWDGVWWKPDNSYWLFNDFIFHMNVSVKDHIY
jgi:hypothetical protein